MLPISPSRNRSKLLQITKQAVRNAKTIQGSVLAEARHLGKDAVRVAEKVKEQIDQYLPLIDKVITQTEHRIFKEKLVTNNEKIISLFELRGSQGQDAYSGQTCR